MAVNTQALFGVVQREGMEKGFWTRIGTAFQNRVRRRAGRTDPEPDHDLRAPRRRPLHGTSSTCSSASTPTRSRRSTSSRRGRLWKQHFTDAPLRSLLDLASA